MNVHGMIPSVPDVPKTILKRNKIYTFSRTASKGSFQATTVAIGALGLSFSLNDLPNVSEFTALFDQYRILQVTVSMVPNVTSSQPLPIYSCIDYDDASVPAASSDIYQKDTSQVNDGTQVIVRTLNPKSLVSAYLSAVSTAYSPEWGVWYDCDQPGVPHYGLKFFSPIIGGNTGLTTLSYNVIAEYVIQTRSVA
jgi:hypothetical protein